MKPPRDSAATVKALHLIDKKGLTAYRAAKTVGINLSTIYRALKRRRERENDSYRIAVAISPPTISV